MKNGAVVDILEKFANLLEFKGENLFKINAYRRAARTIAELGEDIEKVWQEGRLDQLPGIGDAIREKVNQFLLEGRIRQFDELAAAAPREIFDLLSIQHFGPKTAALAFKELGVETVADLRRVLEDGSLSTLPGMGPKKCENILKSLKLHESSSSQISIGLAADLVARVMDHLEKTASGRFGRLSAAGSVRRYKETVHDIDILVEAEDGREIISAFAQMDGVTRVLGAGATKGSILLDDRFQVDLRAVPSESFGAALQYFTGSQEHNVHLREIAKKAGYKVNEYGIFHDDQRVGGQFEEDIYHVL
ncbi:MAG: DNA polymerase III, partial [Calditrichaeota bacterium]